MPHSAIHAILGVLACTEVRVGALAKLRLVDYRNLGALRFKERADAGLPDLFSPHSFRVAVVTDRLNQNIPLKDAQYLAGHSSPMTTSATAVDER